MSASDNRQPPETDAEARAREEAFAAFQRSGAIEDDEPLYVAPRRAVFPPSFLLILAAAFAIFALEPTADLRYELFGPSQAVDLGHPGAYTLDAAQDGARARISGFAGGQRGTFTRGGSTFEVSSLIGLPVLIRRTPHGAVGTDMAEAVTVEGHLLKLEDTPSTWLDRLVRPASRYTTVRLQFEALGLLPPGRDVWLLLDGDLPRSDPWAITEPLLLWTGALVFAFLAWRAYGLRSAAPRRL